MIPIIYIIQIFWHYILLLYSAIIINCIVLNVATVSDWIFGLFLFAFIYLLHLLVSQILGVSKFSSFLLFVHFCHIQNLIMICRHFLRLLSSNQLLPRLHLIPNRLANQSPPRSTLNINRIQIPLIILIKSNPILIRISLRTFQYIFSINMRFMMCIIRILFTTNFPKMLLTHWQFCYKIWLMSIYEGCWWHVALVWVWVCTVVCELVIIHLIKLLWGVVFLMFWGLAYLWVRRIIILNIIQIYGKILLPKHNKILVSHI